MISPLSTVGISLKLGAAIFASGALLLLLTNLARMVLRVSVTFIATGAFAGYDGARCTNHTRPGLMVAAVSVRALGVLAEVGGRPAIIIVRDRNAVDDARTGWIGHRAHVVRGIAVAGDRVEIDLAGLSAPASTADLDRRISARLRRRVMLTVRYTEQRILNTTDSTAP